jgi:hypothetical protein
MSRSRAFFGFATVFALASVYFSRASNQLTFQGHKQRPQGRNNTILVLSDSHRGFANVLLAICHALLLEHSNISNHFVSFTSIASDVSAVSLSTVQQSSDFKTPPIAFRPLSGRSFVQAISAFYNDDIDNSKHAPGVKGSAPLAKNMQEYLMP